MIVEVLMDGELPSLVREPTRQARFTRAGGYHLERDGDSVVIGHPGAQKDGEPRRFLLVPWAQCKYAIDEFAVPAAVEPAPPTPQPPVRRGKRA